MAIPFAKAASAYAATGALPKLGGPGPDTGFGRALSDAAKEALEVMRQGEKKSAEGTLGKADLTDVVTAVSNAEVTLQAVVAIRDRVVSAYQDILRMPI